MPISTGLTSRSAAKGEGHIHSDKWHRCVEHVKEGSPGYEPHAVCTASIGYSGSINKEHRTSGPHDSTKHRKKKMDYTEVLKWDEAKHPRKPSGSAAGGEFALVGENASGSTSSGSAGSSSSGGGGSKSTLTPAQQSMQESLAKQGKKPVFKVKTVEEGVVRILKGDNVELQDTKDVHTVLKQLGEMAIKAKKAGSKAPNFDPCQITVKGTSLFCSQKIKTEEFPNGIPRIEMPQFKSKNPVPGSEADKLKRDSRGEVDATSVFMAHLHSALGVESFSNGKMLARKLKASQAEMEGTKVAAMMLSKRDPKKARITVSSDGYVVDGHHTWAAAIGRDAEDGNLDNDKRMEVVIINMPMSQIYHIAKEWTLSYGLPAAKVNKWEAILKFDRQVELHLGLQSVAS